MSGKHEVSIYWDDQPGVKAGWCVRAYRLDGRGRRIFGGEKTDPLDARSELDAKREAAAMYDVETADVAVEEGDR